MPPPHHRLLTSMLAAAAAVLALIFVSVILYRKITRKRIVPADLMNPPAAALLLLPSGQQIAVKLMSEASIQGDREFQNELSLASRIDAARCPNVVCTLGFSTSDAAAPCIFFNSSARKRGERRN